MLLQACAKGREDMQEVLRKLRAKLTRLARTAEDFRSMASLDWAPRVGAYINAAHWMSHSLQEAAGPLLLLDLEGTHHCEILDGHAFEQRVTTQVSTGYRRDSLSEPLAPVATS